MSRPSKIAVGALLLRASACVAWPLYIQKLWFGSGPPSTTVWAGAPQRMEVFRTVVVVPQFWAFPALTLSAIAWAFIDRRRVAIVTLIVALAGYASLGIWGGRILPGAWTIVPLTWMMSQTESYPAPAFYVAVAAIALALAVVAWSPKRYSNERA